MDGEQDNSIPYLSWSYHTCGNNPVDSRRTETAHLVGHSAYVQSHRHAAKRDGMKNKLNKMIRPLSVALVMLAGVSAVPVQAQLGAGRVSGDSAVITQKAQGCSAVKG